MDDQLRPHLDSLAQNGFAILHGLIDAASVGKMLGMTRALHSARARAADIDQPFLNRGHDVLYNLQRENVDFVRVFTGNPAIMAVLGDLLNDAWYRQIPADRPNFILRALAARSSGPTTLPLHIDSFIPSSGRYCFACQVAVILEDQDEERGCTLVVPGSHRSDRYADQSALADAIPLETRAGDVVIWDGRLWHGALGRRSNESRWSLIATFVRWWMKHNFDLPGTLPQGIYDALTEDEKVVLGYCSIPPRDELDRVDIKAGHEHLKPLVADYRRV
jgi:hypothetical protein